MKKETIIAIFLGIMFGIIVAMVMISKNKEKEMEKSKPITTNITSSPIITLPVAKFQNFEIIEPKDGLIFNKKNIVIKGKAVAGSLIVIQSPIKEVVLKNIKEDFTVDFPLALGDNVIRVSVYPKDTQIRAQEKELHIYYLDE